jgi:hypothetical protein
MATIKTSINAARALRRPVVAVGDFTGGTVADQFTLTAHGLSSGNRLFLIWESDPGVVTGGALEFYAVKRHDDDIFQLTDAAGAVIENSADGTAVFLNVTHP